VVEPSVGLLALSSGIDHSRLYQNLDTLVECDSIA
jgi:hypothetical protein